MQKYNSREADKNIDRFKDLQLNLDEIEKFVELIGYPLEIRICEPVRKSGYFTCWEAVQCWVQEIEKDKPKAFYFSLNEPDKSIYRAAQRNRLDWGRAAGDANIIRRRWFLVDIDPTRPSGTNSSNEAVLAAIEAGKAVANYLSDRGFSRPVVVMSGNGCHLLYRCDLPNDAESTRLIKSTLELLAEKFDCDAFGIDTGVFNASRISKLAGTPTRKGDHSDALPRRNSGLLEVPAEITITTAGTLEAFVGDYKTEVKAEFKAVENYDADEHDEHLATLIDHLTAWGVDYGEPRLKDGRYFVPVECPFCENSAAAIVGPTGVLGYHCFHSTTADCSNSANWKKYRTHYEPEYQERQAEFEQREAEAAEQFEREAAAEALVAASAENRKIENPQTEEPKKPQPAEPKSFAELEADKYAKPLLKVWRRNELRNRQPAKMIIQDQLGEKELCIINGKEGSCKTFFAIEMALTIATGQPDFYGYPCRQANVLYLIAENQDNFSNKRIVAWERFKGVEYSDDNFAIIEEAINLDDPESLELLYKSFHAEGFKPEVIFIDTFGLNLGCSESDQEKVNAAVQNCLDFIRRHGVTIVPVTHPPKNNPDGDPLGNSFLKRHAGRCHQCVKDESNTSIKVYQKKAKDDEGESLRLYLQKEVIRLDGVDQWGKPITSLVLTPLSAKVAEAAEETVAEKIINYLRYNKIVSLKDLTASMNVPASGRARDDFNQVLAALLAGGRIIENKNVDKRRKYFQLADTFHTEAS